MVAKSLWQFRAMVRILLPQRTFCLFLLLRCQANIPACFPFLFSSYLHEFLLAAFYNHTFAGKICLGVGCLDILHRVAVYGYTALLYVSSCLGTGRSQTGFLQDCQNIDPAIGKVLIG